jgi:two-component system, NtrC family, response regulator AtoC
MKILIVDDEKLFRWSLNKTLTKAGYQILDAACVQDAKQIIASEEPDIVILDINLPDGNGVETLKWAKNSFPEMFFLMITAKGKVSDAVDAIRSGAYDYLEKPIDMESILQHVDRVKEVIQLKRQLLRLSQDDQRTPAIIAESPAMTEVLRLARTFSESASMTALLLGESGSGKDIMARYIHEHSNRRKQAFMAINCAAVPQSLLESELFGHERGAFTDAKDQKKGILELAHEGTVFLDEIGTRNASQATACSGRLDF